MTRRILTTLASALLAAAIVVGGSALAASKASTKTVKLKGTIHGHLTGDGATIAGNSTDKYQGAGAVVYKNVSVGTARKVPFTSFGKNGSFRGITTADIGVNPDTSTTITNCTFKVTGGGGAYRHATGSGTCQGHGDTQGYDVITYQGSLKVPK